MDAPMVPVSIGELVDKWVILQIKANRIKDDDKLQNVLAELEILSNIVSPYLHQEDTRDLVATVIEQLVDANEALWDIEDEIRELDREKVPERFKQFFDEEGALGEDECEKVARFFELAQLVYITNDDRCMFKRKLNEILGSELVEEKSYQEY